MVKIFNLEDLVDVGVTALVDDDFLILPHHLVERQTTDLQHRATIARHAVLNSGIVVTVVSKAVKTEADLGREGKTKRSKRKKKNKKGYLDSERI